MTDALAALGVLALVASGQFSRGVDIAISICLILAVAMKESWRRDLANRHVDAIAVLVLVATQLGRAIFTGASILDLLIEFAVGLQIIRVASRKGAAQDQQVIVLALLHLIAGTVVGGGLGYGLCFFGLLIVTPGALVLSHLRREVEGNYRQGARDRTGLPVDVPRILRSKRVVGRQFIAVTCLLSVPILLFTISLFIIFPRVGLSLLLLNRPKGGRMIGFSGKVDLGQIGTLRTDPTIALRVSYSNLPSPPPPRKVMHLRGTALDHYDGRTWSQSRTTGRTIATGGELVPVSGRPEVGVDPVMRIELEPIDPPVIFLPPYTKGIRLDRGAVIRTGSGVSLQRGAEGEFRYQAPNDHGVHYAVFLSEKQVAFKHLRNDARGRYLQLPQQVPDRIGQLAEKWTRDAKGNYRKARAIERQLRTEFVYDLSSPSGEHEQPLDHFLFESKRGHCEYYSTAMAVMLRTLGIPSRNVTGFVGGTWNKYGEFYAVRQGDAHSWVEAYIQGSGWLTFDPTPPGAAVPLTEIEGVLASVRDFFEAVSQRWNRHVLGYDLRQQVRLFESFSKRGGSPADVFRTPSGKRMLWALAGLMLALGSLWYIRRRRKHTLEKTNLGARRRSKEEALATSLYQALDTAMAEVGIGRNGTTPPLGHALTLVKNGHPQSDDIVQLTKRYLDARFGDAPLDAVERRDFDLRIRKIKELGRKGGFKKREQKVATDEATAAAARKAAMSTATPKSQPSPDKNATLSSEPPSPPPEEHRSAEAGYIPPAPSSLDGTTALLNEDSFEGIAASSPTHEGNSPDHPERTSSPVIEQPKGPASSDRKRETADEDEG